MKTNKSYTKRIKVTKKGKILVRKAGQNHFNAKRSGEKSLASKSTTTLSISNKSKSRFLPNV